MGVSTPMTAPRRADDVTAPAPEMTPPRVSVGRTGSLLWSATGVEAFLLALVAVAPLGGISQTISPLARAWPALLLPARALFGGMLVDGSAPSERAGTQLALFAVLLMGATCAAFAGLLYAKGITKANRSHLALALGCTALFGVTLLLLPSLPSDDVFSYILYGRIAAVHHANPLMSAPSAFPSDPFLRLVFWRGVRSVYGPAWLGLSAALTALSELFGGTLATYVLAFKLAGFGAHLANAALIWVILGRLAPNRRLAGTILYAWNPLCLLEFCASAHNDAVMLTCALLGVYFLLRHWEVAALVAFGLSISIKYVLLALLPFYLIMIVRQMREGEQPVRAIAAGLAWRVAIIVGTLGLTLLPFWAGPATLSAILYSPPAQQLDNSIIEALSWPLRSLFQAVGALPTAGASLAQTLLRLAAFAVYAVLWLRLLPRVRELRNMLSAWAWALFWYATVASGWFWPWYATWPVAIVALLAWSEITVAVLLLAGSVLTLYAFMPLYAAGIYGVRAWIVFLPPLGYLIWQRWGATFKKVWRTRARLRFERAGPHA